MPGMNPSSPSGPASPVARIPGLAMYPHDHVCAFVQRSREADELVGPYLRDGLNAGQPCLYLAAPAQRSSVLAMLDAVTAPARPDLLHVVDPESVFLRTGTFDLDTVFEFWDDWARSTLGDAGADRTARVAVDMSWAHARIEPAFIRRLVSYEAHFTRWATSHPQVCLCVYDLDEFGVSTLLPLITSQPTVWLKGVVVDNPYHVDPVDPLVDQQAQNGRGLRAAAPAPATRPP